MIFYFTGTGNSQYAAEKIAEKTGSDVISIAECVRNEKYDFHISEGDILGFVYPVYCWTMPDIVKDFASKIKITSDSEVYSFVLANCGGSTGDSPKHFAKIFPVSALFGIPMIDNYLPLEPKAATKEEAEFDLGRVDVILNGIIDDIQNRKTGNLNKYAGGMGGVIGLITPVMYNFARSTKSFKVSDQCVSCRLCENICPSQAIKITDGRPVWIKPKCTMCYGCLNRCPKNAISLPKTEGKGQYVNPRVEL